MSGTGKISTYFFFRQSQFSPYLIPDRFLTCNSQWHSDSIQCHPVNQAFPILPLPIRHRVTKCTIIQKETTVTLRLTAHRFLNHRKFLRHHNAIRCIPRYMRMTIMLQIVIQSHCYGIVIITLNADFTRLRSQYKMIGL